MAGPPNRYPDTLREAVLRRVLVDRVSASQATREANAGQLPGVDAHRLTEATAREWVRDRRGDIAAKTPPTPEEYIETGNRLWQIHLRELERLERLTKARKRDEKSDAAFDGRLSAAMKRHKEARALLASPTSGDPEMTEVEPNTPRGFVDRLAARPQPSPPTQNHSGEKNGKTAGRDEAKNEAALDSGSNGDRGAVLAPTRPQITPASGPR